MNTTADKIGRGFRLARAMALLGMVFAITGFAYAADEAFPAPDSPWDSPPQPRSNFSPVYPFELRRLGIGGTVEVGFWLTERGKVENVHVRRATHPGFRQAALDAVKQWTFFPAQKDGKPVAGPWNIPIIFRVQGGGSDGSNWRVKRPREFPPEVPAAYRWTDAPKLNKYSAPVYPRHALINGEKGQVTVKFVVDSQGRVIATQAEGDATEPLKLAAVAAVETFEFEPAKQDGAPCGAILNMTFDFRKSLRSDAPVTPETERVLKLLQHDGEGMARLKDLDAIPEAYARRSPVLPPSLKKTGAPAEAMIEFVIDRQGMVQLPRVRETTDEAFGYAAMQAVSDWTFGPPLKDGIAVDVVAVVPHQLWRKVSRTHLTLGCGYYSNTDRTPRSDRVADPENRLKKSPLQSLRSTPQSPELISVNRNEERCSIDRPMT